MDQQNAILEVNQVQTAPKAGFGWQAVLLLTIVINLLTTLLSWPENQGILFFYIS